MRSACSSAAGGPGAAPQFCLVLVLMLLVPVMLVMLVLVPVLVVRVRVEPADATGQAQCPALAWTATRSSCLKLASGDGCCPAPGSQHQLPVGQLLQQQQQQHQSTSGAASCAAKTRSTRRLPATLDMPSYSGSSRHQQNAKRWQQQHHATVGSWRQQQQHTSAGSKLPWLSYHWHGALCSVVSSRCGHTSIPSFMPHMCAVCKHNHVFRWQQCNWWQCSRCFGKSVVLLAWFCSRQQNSVLN